MATIAQKKDLNLYVKAVQRLIRVGAKGNLRKVIGKSYPSDLGTILEHIGKNDRRMFLPLIFEGRKLGETLLEVNEELRRILLSELEDAMVARLVLELSSDDAADLLEILPKERIENILNTIKMPSVKRQLLRLLSFEPNTAGSIMQTEFLALPELETAANAIIIIKRRYREKPIFYLYTVDDENRLSGVVSLRQLLLAEENCQLKSLANQHVIKVNVDEDQEKVAELAYRYDLLAIPVVDTKNHVVGIITVDDIMDVMEEEVSEDIYKLAGSNIEELVYGNRILKISKVRLPWLIVSVFAGLITAFIIGLFHNTLTTMLALASFIPVITGMSGNVGTQTSAITVRGLAVGRLSVFTIGKTVFREMRVGILLGIVSGLSVAIIGYFWHHTIFLGVIIAVSMIAGMAFAAVSGSLMPLLFQKFGIDPAIASGPLVTTLNDCVSVSIYLSVATILLKTVQ